VRKVISSQEKPTVLFYDLCERYTLDYDALVAIAEQAKVAREVIKDMYMGKPVKRSDAVAILKAFSDKVNVAWTLDNVHVQLVGMQQNQSEVARLRATIDAEYESAKLGLKGLAEGTAKHHYISTRFVRMAGSIEALSAIADKSTVDEVIIKLRTLGEYEVDAWIPL